MKKRIGKKMKDGSSWKVSLGWGEEAKTFAKKIFCKDLFQQIDKEKIDEQEEKYITRLLKKFFKTIHKFNNKPGASRTANIMVCIRLLVYIFMVYDINEFIKYKEAMDSNKEDDDYFSQRQNEDHKENLDTDEYRAYS